MPIRRSWRITRITALSLAMLSTQGCMPGGALPQASRALPVPAVATPPRATANATLAMRLAALVPSADPAVIRLALDAQQCAVARGEATTGGRLAVIDYARPSTAKRLWVFDLAVPRLLYDEYVAHGRNTGGNLAMRFSNEEGSLQSSLGLFRTAETYDGENGYSLRMDGLEPGINDRARSRAIVMHGAWYVDPLQALKQGRLGRSLGCPALRPHMARPVINALAGGQTLFAYYPDQRWLSTSRYLNCRQHEPVAVVRSGLHAMAR